jgi:hypothetical protein
MLTRQFIQSVLGFVFLVTSSFALSNTEFTYNVIDGGIEVTGCVNECPSDLVIPEEIDGYTVHHIGHNAFEQEQLVSLVLPDSIMSIKSFAFSKNDLSSLDLSNNLTTIGAFAFRENQLSSLSIPNSVISIESYAFYKNQLQSLTLSESLTSIAASTFSSNNLASVILPESVVSIGDNAFSRNVLVTLNTSNSLQFIGVGAFSYNNLIEVVISESVIFIAKEAFNSNRIMNIFFSGEAPLIETAAFKYNNLYEIFYCHNDNELWGSVLIEGISPQLDDSCDPSNNQLLDYATFDIDQSGSVDALSDGLILLRYFFGLREDSLISGVISPNANRTSASDIEAYIESHMP